MDPQNFLYQKSVMEIMMKRSYPEVAETAHR